MLEIYIKNILLSSTVSKGTGVQILQEVNNTKPIEIVNCDYHRKFINKKSKND
jgi:hypothetical protein